MFKLYRILGWFWIFKAAKRGPGSLIRQRVRAKALGKFARLLRKILSI